MFTVTALHLQILIWTIPAPSLSCYHVGVCQTSSSIKLMQDADQSQPTQACVTFCFYINDFRNLFSLTVWPCLMWTFLVNTVSLKLRSFLIVVFLAAMKKSLSRTTVVGKITKWHLLVLSCMKHCVDPNEEITCLWQLAIVMSMPLKYVKAKQSKDV